MSLEYSVEMPYNLSKINSNNVDELLWWSILAVFPESILTTIDKVSYPTADVRKYLKNMKTTV